MKQAITLLLATALLAACAAQQPPTPSPEMVQTAAANLLTQMASNWTATPQPTATPEPSATPQPPTATAQPSATPESASPTPSPLPPTATATVVVNLGPTNTPLPSRYEGQTALLKFENNTSEEIYIVLYGTAYYEIRFTGKEYKIEDAPWGDYNYTAFIGNEGPYTGFFRITNWDKHTLVFKDSGVNFLGP